MDDSDNLDDTLITKASLPNPPPPSKNSKYRETITPPPSSKLSLKNAQLQKRPPYYREDDEYSYVRSSPKRLPVLRQRYPSYDSFTNQNSRFGSSYSRPHASFRRRHLNVAGDNIVSKSLTRNYIYHRQPFDWYNSSSGILLDDVEEIVPVPGGLDEPHLNAPYERSASDDRDYNDEYENDLRNERKNNNYPRNNSYDSRKEYDYENQPKKNPVFKNFSDESLNRNNKQSITEPVEREDNDNDDRYDELIINKPKDALGQYEKEKNNKASQVFLDDEKKANELVLGNNNKNKNSYSNIIKNDEEIDIESINNTELKFKKSELNNTNNQFDLQPQKLIINAQSVTINADSIKTNLPNNILTESDIGRILDKISGRAFFQPDRNNLSHNNNNNIQPYQQNFEQNYPNAVQQLNLGSQPNTQLQSLYNFSHLNDSNLNSNQIISKNQFPQKPTSFQPFPRLINKKPNNLVKNILKDIVTVASDDAEKVILNNPFDERTDVYKMLKGRSKNKINDDDLVDSNQSQSNTSNLKLGENQKKNVQVFQNAKLVNNNSSNTKSTKVYSFSSQENINAINKLTKSETEKLKKLCESLKFLNSKTEKK
jgi:hypothetical protein